jgi:glycosyltransferase involved in cell wall biosynthesis
LETLRPGLPPPLSPAQTAGNSATTMRVLAVSVAPLFKGLVHGGSQRVLATVVDALAEAGHEVRVLCSQRPENQGGFTLARGVRAEPSLLLSGTFPSPYEVAPYRLAGTASALQAAAHWADRLYLHADAIFMRDALAGRPVIRSLHDFLYEEALLSAFTLPASLTVVPSDYMRRCIEASVPRIGTSAPEPVRVIPNGIEVPARAPRPAAPPGVAPRATGDIVLLYPHRPDARKGIREALQVTAELKRRRLRARVRLLVAAHVDEGLGGATNSYRAQVEASARELGAAGAVEFHAWLPQARMGSLYAFGDVTLCIGSFIESFGLVPVESAVAGTPAVCSRVGALRGLEGLPGLHHVPYGDIAAATDAVESCLDMPMDRKEVARQVAERFSLTAMKQLYVAAITGPLPRPSRATSGPEGGHGLFELAPWCHVDGGRIYNDYEYGYADLKGLAKLLASRGLGTSGKARFSLALARKSGITQRDLHQALSRGYLVPVAWKQSRYS